MRVPFGLDRLVVSDSDSWQFSGNSADEFDFDAAASAFPDISLDGSTEIPAAAAAPLAGGGGGAIARSTSVFSFDDFDTAPQSAVTVTGDDEIEKFESVFPEIATAAPTQPPVQQQPYTTTATATFAPQPQPSGLSSTPILAQTIPEDEPEVIREWREKQREEIEGRDAASKRRREDTIASAERDIEEFYENYAKKKEKSIRENKNTEAEFLAEMQASLSSGTTWERICNLVELQNSQSKTTARNGAGTTDLTRYKEILLRLKREGEAAPGAAGY